MKIWDELFSFETWFFADIEPETGIVDTLLIVVPNAFDWKFVNKRAALEEFLHSVIPSGNVQLEKC